MMKSCSLRFGAAAAVFGVVTLTVACGGDSTSIAETSPDAQPGDAQGTSMPADAGGQDAHTDATVSTAPGSDGGLDATAAPDAPETASLDAGEHDAPASADGSSKPPPSDGSTACSVTASARAAESTGFTGADDAYFALYNVPCSVASDCVQSCTAAGGTSASCTLGSQCVDDPCDDGGVSCPHCLPPTYWLDMSGALGQPGAGMSLAANDLQAFDNGYNDSMTVTNFGLVLPAGATVRGIEFHVDREASDDLATDQSIRVMKTGAPIGLDYASGMPVPQAFTEMTYGGPTDTWGASWVAADVAATGFGISMTEQYGMTAGNDTVYVDSVTATVFYGGTTGCP